MHPRGVCRRVLELQGAWEGPLGKAAAANRTREIRPSGMRGGLAETRAMGVGLRPTGKPADKPPNPKAARAVFLPDGSKTTYDSRNRFNMVHYKMFLFA